MTLSAIDIDPIGFSWVTGEIDLLIDLLLGRAIQITEPFDGHAPGVEQLHAFQTLLRRLYGILSLFGSLASLAQVCLALEHLFVEIGQGEKAFSSSTSLFIQQTLSAVRRCMALLPDKTDACSFDREQVSKKSYARFEQGFLRWLKKTEDKAGLQSMRQAIHAMEQLYILPQETILWWMIGRLCDVLTDNAVAVETSMKRLMMRINTYIRHLFEASPTSDVSLVQDIFLCLERHADICWNESVLPQPAVSSSSEINYASLLQTSKSLLAKEIRANLFQIEQTLDAFFRDIRRREELQNIDKPLKQVANVLSIVGEEQASILLRKCMGHIQFFATHQTAPDIKLFEYIAYQLAALTFYIEIRQYGLADLDAILQPDPFLSLLQASELDAAPLQDDIDDQLLPIFVEEATELIQSIRIEMQRWETAPQGSDVPQVLARLLHTLKGGARMVGAMVFGKLLHTMETRLIDALNVHNVAPELFKELRQDLERGAQLLEELQIRLVSPVSPLPVLPQEDLARDNTIKYETLDERSVSPVLRVRADVVDYLIYKADEIQLARIRLESDVHQLKQALHDLEKVKQVENIESLLMRQAALTHDLENLLKSVRLMPASSVVERLQRIVKQTAQELGKLAHLEIQGAQNEISCTIFDQMIGPIEHLLRNAVMHGIEAPAVRHSLGKENTGHIMLSLMQLSQEMIIELSDDGAGLDLECIRAKAIGEGLLSPQQEADVDTLVSFIFKSGFSTSKTLTEIAGRGIGMNIVYSETVKLGGYIQTSTQVGRGTCFRIHLPFPAPSSV